MVEEIKHRSRFADSTRGRFYGKPIVILTRAKSVLALCLKCSPQSIEAITLLTGILLQGTERTDLSLCEDLSYLPKQAWCHADDPFRPTASIPRY